ncbi:MAG: glycoside hydrolase family 32 protein [Fuerstiella sp.]
MELFSSIILGLFRSSQINSDGWPSATADFGVRLQEIIRDMCDLSSFSRRHGVSKSLLAAALIAIFVSPSRSIAADQPDPLALNFHLMHPGGDSKPGDPNAAFYLDGTYHLHYILVHDWTVEGKTRKGFSFVHVTSPDMLHWTWQKTKLQPTFTGHNMYSGTGFLTKHGMPAVIYHGGGSRRNQIAIAKDHKLSAWEKPFPVEPKTADGKEAVIKHWDPDCFLIGDTYYAFSGGRNPPLMKSKDLKSWIHVGDFFSHEPDNVAIGEDVSCGNFFSIGDKWMLQCISHPYGCRYYLGDWDAEAEQFVPETHGRMNWRSDDQDSDSPKEYRDFFASESVLTEDGRRVMWAWLTTLHNNALRSKTIQSLPRELSIGEDGGLRIKPLHELKAQRFDLVTLEDIEVAPKHRTAGGETTTRIAQLEGNAYEIRITIDRQQAKRKRFGFRLFADENRNGLPINFQPNNGTLRVGGTEAPFKVADLPAGEDVELRIFIDKYLVEVFVNGRQAMVAADMDWQEASGFDAYAWGAPTMIKTVEIWKIKPTNQGYLEARGNRIWEPDTE